jgi:DNA-binding SARP family transcriptional activator
LLGAPAVRRAGDGRGASLLTQPLRIALLAYLVLARPRGLHTRDALIALFWIEQDVAHGRRALRNALHGIRQALGPAVIVTAGDTLVGVDPALIVCDVLVLEADLADGRLEGAEAVRDRALLQGFHVSAVGFERWLDAEREHLRRLLVRRALTILEDCRMRGDLDGTVRAARVASALDPDGERPLRHLVEALVAAGDRTAAIDAYEGFVSRLKVEYDTKPSAETARLGAQLREPVREPSSAHAAAEVLNVRGTYLFLRAAHGGHPDDMLRSRAFFEQALELDPLFAPAWAGLSNFFAAAAARNLLRPFHEHFAHAIALSHKALALDPSLAIPHVHFGVQAMYLDDDWETAGREFATAVALDPGYAEARRFLGVHHAVMGRADAAIAELRETVRREPHIAMFRNSLADAYMSSGAPESAVPELRAALDADPRYTAARERLVRCFERLGRFAEAIAERRFMGAAGRADQFQAALESDGEAGYRREREVELRDALRRLEATLRDGPPQHAGDHFNPPQLRLALLCAELGDDTGARHWEDHACRSRPGRRPWFASRAELRRS